MAGTPAYKKAARVRRGRKGKLNGLLANASPRLARHDVGGNTPLKFPNGNKEVALELGARYGAGGSLVLRTTIARSRCGAMSD
jgi:hypothetical protein